MQPVEYAQYTFAIAIIVVVSQTLSSGFNRIYIVGYERFNLKESLLSFLGCQLLGIVFLVLITLPFRGKYDGVYWMIAGLVTATCLSEFSKTAYQQELRFINYSIVEIFRSAFLFILTLIIISCAGYELKAWMVLAAQMFAMLLSFFLTMANRLELRPMLRVSAAGRLALKIIAGKYKYLFGYYFLLTLFSQSDIFMLRTLADDNTLATYGSAFRYYNLILLSLGAVHAVLLPTIQRVENIQELNDIIKMVNKLLLIFVPVVLGGAWASQWIIPWIDHGKYPNAILVFRILSISAILSFAFSPHVNLILRFEEFKFLLLLVCVSLFLDIIFNVILIPRLGAAGAAISNLIAFGFLNGAIFWRSLKQRKIFMGCSQGAS